MLGLIIKREFTTMLGSKAMKISTAVIVTLLLAAGVVGRFLIGGDSDTSSSPATFNVTVTGDAAALAPYLKNLGATVTEATGDPAELARDTDEPVVSGDPTYPTITQTSDDTTARDVIVQAATNRLLDEAGVLTPELSQNIAALQAVTPTNVSSNANLIEHNPVGYLAGMVGIMILMMVTVMGISVLSAGVVEEKSSRIVEILLTTVRPRTLLLGKILGIGSALLVVFLIYMAGIIGGLGIAGLLSYVTDLGSLGLWGYIPMLVLWIVLGYFTNAAITGGLAATVSRQEDLGAVQSPIIFLQLIPLYIAMYLVPLQPEAAVTHVLSYIPFLSPYLMPMRIAVGEVAVWEQALAVGLTVITIPLLGALAGKIYERSILHTGERMKLSQVLRSRV
ncbi:MAG: ABC transporter permease [Ancrocorticia sp.]|jgi:ABC-2 type transport system permease protein|nr:ABC transporter permease [Ancrocorticia sp.]MCI2178088.1 ABC transporter permease [Ancrocorticia sp.]MCI2193895.1 ABC transporter permease [Ancrocorticia sp.]MCI2199402.1 ABC transporter permease [Ancrocorticia sp.]